MRLCLSLAACAVAISLPAAASPITASTSGYLLDAVDHPVQGTLDMTFRLYDEPGALVWTSATCPVAVAQGYYAVVLGAGCQGTPALDSTHVPAGQRRFLELTVSTVTLAPRIELAAAPVAASAMTSLDTQALATTLASATGTLNAAANPVDWSQLKGVPGSITGGTISTGTWQATPVADAYVASAATWNSKLAEVAHDATLSGAGTGASSLGVVYGSTANTAAQGNDPRLADARAPTSGSANYLQNGTSPQAASFNVTGKGVVAGSITTNSQIRSANGASVLVNAGTTIDWDKGNVQTTTASCTTGTPMVFSNMLEGGAYTLIVTGGTAATCTFGQTTNPDTLAPAAFRFQPANGPTTAGTITVYTFLRANNAVFVSWISGF